MANCGIHKYDRLPACIGFRDVDALRFALSETISRERFLVDQLESARREHLKKIRVSKL